MFYIFKTKPLLLLLAALFLLVYACKKDDDTDSTRIQLLSFGPSPVLRGGELRFIGHNLDQVTAIILSDNVEVTSFKTKTPELLVIEVPEATVDGKVTLKTPQGDIQTKTLLKISEPITLTSISPDQSRPGDVVTLEGTYLNLIKEVIFSNKKAVGDSAFLSQTRTKIEVRVPEDAQTGVVVVSNGLADPILVESKDSLLVTLPAVTALSPTPVKAGTALTIAGTDLDLVREIVFGGGVRATAFTSVSPTELVVEVPATAKDGVIKLGVASLLQVTTTQEVVLKVPVITAVAPNPAKNGQTITVQGTDLDLITRATFGGGKAGELQAGGSSTEITVKVPIDATEGTVAFGTAADKSVSSEALTLVRPVITAISLTEIQVNNPITITGTNLDLVTTVKFSGDKEAAPTTATETELVVTVPVGTTSGTFTLVTGNGSEITSSQLLTILASTSATVTDMPASAKPGEMINIVGVNLDEVTAVIFPVGVSATMFGIKNATLIQVVIPMGVQTGVGRIKLITALGEITETPEINIQGVDPVVDPSLVFFNFDDLGFWWNDAGALENEPALTLNGTNYLHVNKACSGWTGFFWRNGGNGFPGATIGTNVNDYNLKFDINVLEPITGGEFAWRLKGSAGDYWYYWKPWEATGSYVTPGWITVTIPLNAFSNGSSPIADLSTITEDFGVAFNNGASQVNALFDNVRFEHK